MAPESNNPALPVRVAILGAGIFATDAYGPVLKEIPGVLLPRYVWSRSQDCSPTPSVECIPSIPPHAGASEQEAAEKLAGKYREWAGDVEAVWGEQGLITVQGDSAVPCCAVALPIQHQPAMVRRMLGAGKHVLQEKPLAVSEEEALALVHWYRDLRAPGPTSPKPFWGVAENFRLEPVFAQAASLVSSLGQLLSCSVCIEVAMAPSNKYFGSQWRREAELEGAFIADCGVHYVAGLRELVRRQVSWVSAHTSHMNPALPGPDNLTATFILEGKGGARSPSGTSSCVSGTLQVTFCAPLNKMLWRAVCEHGVVEVTRGTHSGKFGYLVSLIKLGAPPDVQFCDFGGIDLELRAFALEVASRGQNGAAYRSDLAQQRDMLSPLQALEDLVVISACLRSGKENASSIEVSKHDVSLNS